jgi:hypothetical protein
MVLIPKKVGRYGRLLVAELYDQSYDSRLGDYRWCLVSTIYRRGRSWQFQRATRPVRLKDGSIIGVSEWIAPEDYASMREWVIGLLDRWP